ncbi:hypothetical protein [Leptospira weilii]|uniref:hypothetical protein n=1 Tax=Leptospira weilii TaxID=28184 RepID=UPI0012DA7845|nr:hypothetical protein [Leptospira weilii]
MDRLNSANASLWIGQTQRMPLYGSAKLSECLSMDRHSGPKHRIITFAFCYIELTLNRLDESFRIFQKRSFRF